MRREEKRRTSRRSTNSEQQTQFSSHTTWEVGRGAYLVQVKHVGNDYVRAIAVPEPRRGPFDRKAVHKVAAGILAQDVMESPKHLVDVLKVDTSTMHH